LGEKGKYATPFTDSFRGIEASRSVPPGIGKFQEISFTACGEKVRKGVSKTNELDEDVT